MTMVRNLTAPATISALALCLTTALAFGPQAGRVDPQSAVAKSEQAVGRIVGDYVLTDSNGDRLRLASYRGKPLVVSLVYTSCSSICPPTTQHLIVAVNEARRIFGPERFEVLTVGFDARHDTPVRLAQFAATQGVMLSNWRLASGDTGTLDALLRDLGFSYVTAAGGFDHVSQTTIVDRDGRVSRQVYGDDFPIQMFIEPLKDAVYGTSGSTSFGSVFDRIRFICTAYDPGAGRYRIDYGLIFGSVIAACSLLVFGALLLREWRRSVRT
jgi:protein SCO1/2